METYPSALNQSGIELLAWIFERDLLAPVVTDGGRDAEEEFVQEADLLRFRVVLQVDVDGKREAAISGLDNLIRSLFDD